MIKDKHVLNGKLVCYARYDSFAKVITRTEKSEMGGWEVLTRTNIPASLLKLEEDTNLTLELEPVMEMENGYKNQLAGTFGFFPVYYPNGEYQLKLVNEELVICENKENEKL
jgi:hypothetical protein